MDRSSVATGSAIHIDDGTLEALKWISLVLMVLDHVNKWIFDAKLPHVSEAARVVAPTFAFVLAYNLARPGALESGAFGRVARRLALFGLLATPPYAALNGSWWPLNILFTLLAGLAVTYGMARSTVPWLVLAGVVFAFGGVVVEYFHPGLMILVAAWLHCRRPSWTTLTAWCLSVAALRLVNGNWWALAAIPLLLGAAAVPVRFPRARHAFYIAYPAHLLAIWGATA